MTLGTKEAQTQQVNPDNKKQLSQVNYRPNRPVPEKQGLVARTLMRSKAKEPRARHQEIAEAQLNNNHNRGSRS